MGQNGRLNAISVMAYSKVRHVFESTCKPFMQQMTEESNALSVNLVLENGENIRFIGR